MRIRKIAKIEYARKIQDDDLSIINAVNFMTGYPDLESLPYELDRLNQYALAYVRRHGGIFVPGVTGKTFCKIGDYIVKGTDGIFYPLSVEQFERDYEIVED